MLISGAGIPLAGVMPQIDNETPGMVLFAIIFLCFLGAAMRIALPQIEALKDVAKEMGKLNANMAVHNEKQGESNTRMDELCSKLAQSPCLMKDGAAVQNLADALIRRNV